MNHEAEELLSLINKRAENLVLTRQSMCAEAVLTVLNQGLGGGLSPEMVIQLTSGLSEGLGGTGCLCGAVNGGALVLGLFLGPNSAGFAHKKQINSATKLLHDRFKDRFGSTCCKVLTNKYGHDKKEQFDHCTRLTGMTAELAAEIILDNRPELVDQADWEYLKHRDGKVTSRLKQVAKSGSAQKQLNILASYLQAIFARSSITKSSK